MTSAGLYPTLGPGCWVHFWADHLLEKSEAHARLLRDLVLIKCSAVLAITSKFSPMTDIAGPQAPSGPLLPGGFIPAPYSPLLPWDFILPSW